MKKQLSVGGSVTYTLSISIKIHENIVPEGTSFWIGYWGAPYLCLTVNEMIQITPEIIAKLNKLLNQGLITEKFNKGDVN